MTTTEITADTSAGANRTGLYLAFLQLVFTLGWTTYVIYLPKLAAQVGIAPSAVILILMLDQAIFTISDTAMGIAADKIAPFVGRLGVFVGSADRALLRGFCRAAFRGRHRAGRASLVHRVDPDLDSDVVGLARTAADFARKTSRPAGDPVFVGAGDARLWFGRCGIAVSWRGPAQRGSAAAVRDIRRGLAAHDARAVEGRARPRAGSAARKRTSRTCKAARPGADVLHCARWSFFRWAINCISAINSAPFFLRFATPDQLQWLLPVFWIGFNIAMFPASVIVKHRGGLIVMGAAGLLGALAVFGAELAGNLNMLIVAQFVAGAAWGCMLMSAVSAALAIGETGAEGKVVGLVFSALALATFARMAAVAGGLQKLPEYAPLLQWAPVACWSVAGAGLLVIAASRTQRSMATAGLGCSSPDG